MTSEPPGTAHYGLISGWNCIHSPRAVEYMKTCILFAVNGYSRYGQVKARRQALPHRMKSSSRCKYREARIENPPCPQHASLGRNRVQKHLYSKPGIALPALRMHRQQAGATGRIIFYPRRYA